MTKHLPATLVLARLVLGAVMLVGASLGWPASALAAALVAALLTDIFDGVLARRWGLATERLRTLDSRVDAVFVVCALVALVIARGAVLRRLWLLLAVTFLSALPCPLVDLLRYRRLASYHAYSAKLSGLLLAVAGVAVLLSDRPGAWLALAALVTVASHLEHLAISLTLPAWTCDVRHLAQARRLRRMAP